MMLKVTLKFSFYCVIFFVAGCSGVDKKYPELATAHVQDSVSEARIDSAYAAIRSQCDTLMVHQVPQMIDSLLKDSALLNNFFRHDSLYYDSDKKVEKVIRQLLADCDSSLLKETYRRAQLQQKSKTRQRPKRKVSPV
jgi:hypothetical protein